MFGAGAGGDLCPDDTWLAILAPTLVIGFHLAVLWVLRHFVIVIVSRQAEGDHEAIFRPELVLHVKVAVLRADHDRVRPVVHQIDELGRCIKSDCRGDQDAKAETLPSALITAPVRQPEEKRLAELVKLDGSILHASAPALLLVLLTPAQPRHLILSKNTTK